MQIPDNQMGESSLPLITKMIGAPAARWRQYGAYGSVGSLVAVVDYPLVVLLPAYLALNLGFGLATIGFLFALARALDVITDLQVGVFVDSRLRTFSSRLWFTISAIPLLIISIFLAFNIKNGDSFAWVAFVLTLLYVSRTAVDVPHASLGAILQVGAGNNYSYFTWRSIFAVVGVLVAAFVILLTKGELGQALSHLSRISALIGLICFIVMLVTFRGTKVELPRRSEKYTFRDILNVPKSMRQMLLAFFLNQVGNAFAASLVVIYIKEVLEREYLTGVFLGVLFVCSALSAPVWFWVTRIWKAQIIWTISIVCASVSFLIVPFLSEGDTVPYLLVCIVAGTCFGADGVIPPALLSELIAQHNRTPATATYFGLKSSLSKFSLAVPVIVAFPILGLSAMGNAAVFHEIGKDWVLVFFYSVLPVIFKLSAARIVFSSKPSSLGIH